MPPRGQQHLRAVDSDGEVHDQCPGCASRDDQIAGLQEAVKDLQADVLVKNQKIRDAHRKVAEVHGTEPNAGEIREVLDFWRVQTGHLKAQVGPGSKRWVVARARLKQGFTVDRLKAAVVGATMDPWVQAKPGRDDVTLILANEIWVERLERTAEERGKRKLTRKQALDLTPLEAAALSLRREFGFDLVEAIYDEGRQLVEVWGPCPLHAEGVRPRRALRLQEEKRHGPVVPACAEGCNPDDVMDGLRALYGLQYARDDGEEVARLRVALGEALGSLRLFSHSAGQMRSDEAAMAAAADAYNRASAIAEGEQ